MFKRTGKITFFCRDVHGNFSARKMFLPQFFFELNVAMNDKVLSTDGRVSFRVQGSVRRAEDYYQSYLCRIKMRHGNEQALLVYVLIFQRNNK